MLTLETLWFAFYALPDGIKLLILVVVPLIGVLIWNATPWGKNTP
jgi:hypothetical protein